MPRPDPARTRSQAPCSVASLTRGLTLALALALTGVTTVTAQDAPDAQPGQADLYDEPEYQRCIAQALQEFQRGNWDEAEGLFAEAHRIHPNARTLRGIGVTAFEARRYVRALQHLRAALRSNVNPLTDDQRAEVESAIERAERYVATIELTVDPAHADVRVNGEPLAQTGPVRTTQVDPGLIQVQASAQQHVSSLRELRVAAGEHQQLALCLVAERTDVPGKPAPPPTQPPETAGPPFRVWKWLALGVGGLALLGGGGAHLKRELTAADYNDDAECHVRERGRETPTRCGTYREEIRDAELFMAIGYGSGALFVGAAALMFALDGASDDEPERASGCTVGAFGLRCGVRF